MNQAIADGGHLVPGEHGYVWSAPAALPSEVISEATRAANLARGALQPAAEPIKKHWLTQLGQLCVSAGDMGVREAMAKIAAYSRDLDQPSFCFTDETRRDAGRRFKFYPSFSELGEFLDGIAAPQRERLRRLERLETCRVAPADVPGPRTVSPETQRILDEMRTRFPSNRA